MKNAVMIMMFLTSTFFNVSLSTANNEEEKTAVKVVSAPEIIACEVQGSCEMTSLASLVQEDEEEQKQAEQQKKNKVMLAKY